MSQEQLFAKIDTLPDLPRRIVVQKAYGASVRRHARARLEKIAKDVNYHRGAILLCDYDGSSRAFFVEWDEHPRYFESHFKIVEFKRGVKTPFVKKCKFTGDISELDCLFEDIPPHALVTIGVLESNGTIFDERFEAKKNVGIHIFDAL
jgi:hypothetical protein